MAAELILEHLPSWQHMEWDRLSLEDLVTIQRKARTAIEAKRKLDGKSRHINSGGHTLPEPLYGGKTGYRALITQVAPAHQRDAVEKLDRCILGVSLGGGNAATFHGAKLEAIVRWIAARANHCCVLVGDSLGRISVEVREGMAPDEAAREARALGRRYVAETEAIFRHYSSDQVTFEFRYGTQYADHPSFQPSLDDVRALYQRDAAFRDLVHAFAAEYLSRTARSLGHGEASLNERWQQIAREYLIEEIALLACFAADGWPVLVYPGSINSIVEIAEGRYPALPAPLQALRFIALWLDAKSGAR
jgi:tRNA-dependent cyclodipeptide synthase